MEKTTTTTEKVLGSEIPNYDALLGLRKKEHPNESETEAHEKLVEDYIHLRSRTYSNLTITLASAYAGLNNWHSKEEMIEHHSYGYAVRMSAIFSIINEHEPEPFPSLNTQ